MEQSERRIQYAILGFVFAILAALALLKWDTSLFLIIFVVAPVLLMITLGSLIYGAIAHLPVKNTAQTLGVVGDGPVFLPVQPRAPLRNPRKRKVASLLT
jgi:hypothetical protein